MSEGVGDVFLKLPGARVEGMPPSNTRPSQLHVRNRNRRTLMQLDPAHQSLLERMQAACIKVEMQITHEFQALYSVAEGQWIPEDPVLGC